MSNAQDITTEDIRDWLLNNIAQRLEMKPEDIRLDEPVTSLGLSSREAIMISGELEEWLGCELSPEILYEYPEIGILSQKVMEVLQKHTSDAPSFHSRPREGKDEMTYDSFVDLVQARAREIPEKDIFIFLADGETETSRINMAQIDLRARAIAAHLQQQGAEGKPVLLVYPPGIEFITGFLGCLYAKAVAVPAYPPTKNRGMERLDTIAADCDAHFALSTAEGVEQMLRNKKVSDDSFIRRIRLLASDAIPDAEAERWKKPLLSRPDLCFLQYTSGSTGNPKGVMVSHGNILHNVKAMREAFGLPEYFNMVSWLPMFHDMGLIGHVLEPINAGCTQVTMPPNVFLEKPVRWLKAIAGLEHVYTTAPNFAFDYCVDKITDAEMQGIDLRSWRLVCNGSEPVREDTMMRFTKRFAPYGFRHNVFFPSYGMAEATLLISVRPDPSAEPRVVYLNAGLLENNQVVADDPDAESAVAKVSCGTARHGRLIIAHPETLEKLPENRVGEIWYQSDSVAQGYWNKPELTERTFQVYTAGNGAGPFMRTGDLGFLQQGELFITGRLKDLIIIRGRNHYPQDIEETVQGSHPALTINAGAAFTVDAHGEEQLVVVQEVERTALRELDTATVFDSIRSAVAEEHNISLYAIVLLAPGQLPRTTSGKIQRRASKRGFLENTLNPVGEWKMARVDVPAEDLSGWTTDQLLRLPLPERTGNTQQYLLHLIAKTMRMAPEQIDPTKPIIHLGFDSIHAIEIKNRIETDFGFELPATRLMEGISISDLARIAAENLKPRAVSPEPRHTAAQEGIDADTARDLLLDIDNLSPEDVERLLAALDGKQ